MCGRATARALDSRLAQGHGVPTPPDWLFGALAQRLRAHLGLSLFNFDVILPRMPAAAPAREGGRPEAAPGAAAEPPAHSGASDDHWLLHVIDINYFPGYEKLPGYEDLMVGFLRSVLDDSSGGGGGGRGLSHQGNTRGRGEPGAGAGSGAALLNGRAKAAL